MLRRLLYVALALFGLAAVAVLGGFLALRLAAGRSGAIVSSGVRRTYLLHVPRTYDPSTPTPLVISLHGYMQWPAHQAYLSHWNQVADEEGFIAVYPRGARLPLRWQTGTSGEADDPERDVRFIADLIDHLSEQYNVDPARVYVNGMSNGGGMTYILSCALSERIAAVGMVAGAYTYPSESCAPARAVPAIVFHGTADRIASYEGGAIRQWEARLPRIPEWVDALARRNGCSGATEDLPASGDVRGVRYADGAADVAFYTIEGGGHTWPGGAGIPRAIGGRTSHAIDATRVMWDFFLEHPLPAR